MFPFDDVIMNIRGVFCRGFTIIKVTELLDRVIFIMEIFFIKR